MNTFRITDAPINLDQLKRDLSTDSTGAISCFEGLVRNRNENKDVLALEYQAMDSLCKKEASKIFAEVCIQFDVTNIKCVHRIGKLSIGDLAVWVGVSAAHRDDAFKACRYVIDEIKARLPIWKKEHYQSGDSGWINCQHTVEPLEQTSNEDEYYSRQVCMVEFGRDGQKRLKESKVLVVGAGGLGNAALLSLASAGTGQIGIVEFDNLETSNLHRQPMYAYTDVGKPKIQLASARLNSINPFIKVREHATKLDVENIEAILSDYDLILDCTDNFPTKFLINDAAVLMKKVLIQASIYQLEGQIRLYHPHKPSLSCLRCLWPAMPAPGCVGNCAETGVLGPIPNILGHMQALEAIKVFLNLPSSLYEQTLLIDFTTNQLRHLKEKQDPDCPVCGNNPTIRNFNPNHYVHQSPSAITIADINQEKLSQYKFVDLREPMERLLKPSSLAGCIELPFSQFDQSDPLPCPFEDEYTYVLFCSKGIRSDSLAQRLRQQGINNVVSLRDGVSALDSFKINEVKSP